MNIPYSKFRYYVLFLYYKLRILIDCKSGRMNLYLAEIIHLINSIFRTSFEMPGKDRIGRIETIFGKFSFIADNYGYSILSPAFERPDIELFIGKIRESIRQGKKVLFLDVGANVGLYSIGVNRAIKSKRLTTIAIEPDPLYHELLCKNIKANDISRITVYHIALSDEAKKEKTKGFILRGGKAVFRDVVFRMEKLDSIIPASYYQQFDEVFVKIDIEGHERSAMEGAKNLWKGPVKIHLMIEDCVNPSIIRYLRDKGFRFVEKNTPYDSFWEKN